MAPQVKALGLRANSGAKLTCSIISTVASGSGGATPFVSASAFTIFELGSPEFGWDRVQEFMNRVQQDGVSAKGSLGAVAGAPVRGFGSRCFGVGLRLRLPCLGFGQAAESFREPQRPYSGS